MFVQLAAPTATEPELPGVALVYPLVQVPIDAEVITPVELQLNVEAPFTDTDDGANEDEAVGTA